ncbi:MAG: cobyric acid synthase [Aliishimia sp.]
MVKALMVQGTGSNVGKSLLVAGLARAFTQDGFRVRPFKPQNMSNNAAVTADGGEIGRAQALQARAAGVATSVHMNPVLLKPESETGAQVIVQGQRVGTSQARSYGRDKSTLLPSVLDSFQRLMAECDLILVEGAGSPAETNLRANDIANMGFACAAGVPVVLVGDINRGGVIAQLVGTHNVLNDEDRNWIKAFAVNRFRGDVSLFDEGVRNIASRTNWPALGVIPWFDRAHLLPAEDVLDLRSADGGSCKVVVPQLPRIANFDDLDPLAAEPSVNLQFIPAGQAFPGDADIVILPGSKSTISDLAFFRAQGWDIDLEAHIRRKGHVLGLCGGYQMLGKTVSDPDGIEGTAQTVPGLGHLNIDTVLSPQKQLALRHGTALPFSCSVSGYEIHMGQTDGPDCETGAWLNLGGELQGASSNAGRIRGAYLHGLFSDDAFRAAYMGSLGHQSTLDYEPLVEAVLDELADHLRQHLDLPRLLEIASSPTF